MSDLNQPTRYFRGLQQGAFMRLEHAASLKGLLKPFKGKGDLEAWASQCFAMRDELIGLAQRQVLQQGLGPLSIVTNTIKNLLLLKSSLHLFKIKKRSQQTAFYLVIIYYSLMLELFNSTFSLFLRIRILIISTNKAKASAV